LPSRIPITCRILTEPCDVLYPLPDYPKSGGPNRVQQVILGDHALSILNQINQQIENLRPDGDLLGTSPKLAPVDIQDVVLKEKLHFDPPRVAPAILRPSSVASAILSKNQADFKGQLSAV
jgi:hypothetical protein